MKQIINRLFHVVQKDNYKNSRIEARNYVLQKRYARSPQAPIGFKSRSTSSYYLTTIK